MTIKLKLYCPGIKIDMTGNSMEVPEGTTVGDVLAECLKQPGMKDEILEGAFMVDKMPATINTVLEEGQELIVIKVINGG